MIISRKKILSVDLPQSPPRRILCVDTRQMRAQRPKKTHFLQLTASFSRMPPPQILCVDLFQSPLRRILCVDKIHSPPNPPNSLCRSFSIAATPHSCVDKIHSPPNRILCVATNQSGKMWGLENGRARDARGKNYSAEILCAPRISADRDWADIAQPAEENRAAGTGSCLHSQKES